MLKNQIKNYLLLITIISTIVVIDRLLLWHFSLPLWEWDSILHYKHRPNTTSYWVSFNHKIISINEYGQHDDSYPLKKKKNELRILNLGDSITMGHGVTKDETYSKFLETILADSLNNYSIVQSINAGVQGYSSFQELEVLKRDLIFKPDIITLGFCLNDVTEPFAVNNKLGGTGLDYHKVTQAPNAFLSFLLNETGFGRLIQEIRIRKLDAKQTKIEEVYNVKNMLLNKNDPKYKAQWAFTLKELNKIYSVCREYKIPVILLIFPYTFQINNPSLQWAQETLIQNADANKVPYINYLNLFENVIKSDSLNIAEYFIDEDHFTPKGHLVVAQELSKSILKVLERKN